jgi:hypothetical protein
VKELAFLLALFPLSVAIFYSEHRHKRISTAIGASEITIGFIGNKKS